MDSMAIAMFGISEVGSGRRASLGAIILLT